MTDKTQYIEYEDGTKVELHPYDDAPELGEDFFSTAKRGTDHLPKEAQAAIKRMGRPPSANPKKQVTVRLDEDLLAALRATGAGWQTRMNDLLRDSFEDRL